MHLYAVISLLIKLGIPFYACNLDGNTCLTVQGQRPIQRIFSAFKTLPDHTLSNDRAIYRFVI